MLEKSSQHQGIQVSGYSTAQAGELLAKGHEIIWTYGTLLLPCPANALADYAMTEARNIPCVIRIDYGPDGETWDVAADPRKEDSGSCIYLA